MFKYFLIVSIILFSTVCNAEEVKDITTVDSSDDYPVYIILFGLSYHTNPYYSDNDLSPYHPMVLFEVIPWKDTGILVGEYVNSFEMRSKIAAATFRQQLYQNGDFSIEANEVIGVADGYYKNKYAKNGLSLIGWIGSSLQYRDYGINLSWGPSIPNKNQLYHIFILTFSIKIC